MQDLDLIETDAPPTEAYGQALATLRAYTAEKVGPPDNRDFAVLIPSRDRSGYEGGLWAQSRWGVFYIDMLVVPSALRGRGLGERLMERAEVEARRRRCWLMWLDTYAFQARPFYEKLGFEVFACFDGPEPIYPRFFMKKMLDQPSPESRGG